jgi:ankyrin repeat protein
MKKFTDPTLSDNGVLDSIEAGVDLKQILHTHGITKLDFIGSSPMLRAIETAYYMTSDSWPHNKIHVFPFLRECEECKTKDTIKSLNKTFPMKTIQEQKTYLQKMQIENVNFNFVQKDQVARSQPGDIKKFIEWFVNDVIKPSKTSLPDTINVLIILHSRVLRAYGSQRIENNAGFMMSMNIDDNGSLNYDKNSVRSIWPVISKKNLKCPTTRCEDVCNPDFKKVISDIANDKSMNKNKNSPLMMAIGLNRTPEIIKLIQDFPKQINYKNKNGDNALIYAIKNNNILITEMLLKANARVDNRTLQYARQMLPIKQILKQGLDYLKTIKLLIKAGIDTEELLRETAKNGHLPIVKLLTTEADTDALNEALLISAKSNHVEVVKYLLKNGADVNILFDNGLILNSLGNTVKMYLIKTFDIMDPIIQQIVKEIQGQELTKSKLTILLKMLNIYHSSYKKEQMIQKLNDIIQSKI